MRLALVAILVTTCAAGSMKEVMTLCRNCTDKEGCVGHAAKFDVPVGECFSPTKVFPNSSSWGKFDVLDICSKDSLNRTFYASTDGSCSNVTDSYNLELNVCLGPFGQPNPWGIFQCSVDERSQKAVQRISAERGLPRLLHANSQLP